MQIDKLTVGEVIKVKMDFGITLWQSIKLRIAGKGYEVLANRMVDEFLKKELSKDDPFQTSIWAHAPKEADKLVRQAGDAPHRFGFIFATNDVPVMLGPKDTIEKRPEWAKRRRTGQAVTWKRK